MRSANLPDVPTVAESGLAGFDAPAWWAVLAPAKTPPEIVKRMNDEINAALKLPDVAAKLAGQGIEVRNGTPQAASRASLHRRADRCLGQGGEGQRDQDGLNACPAGK